MCSRKHSQRRILGDETRHQFGVAVRYLNAIAEGIRMGSQRAFPKMYRFRFPGQIGGLIMPPSG